MGPPAHIDLWYTILGDVDEGLLPRYRALLGAQESARLERFHFARDRRRDLITRALARTVLSRYAAVAAGAWVFSPDANGRPRIVSPCPGRPLEFNISHSGEMVALAVAARPVGVDVECLSRDSDIERLERYFSPTEREALLALAPDDRRRRFFELWTLKESYLKARGVGLRLPLDAFTFEFPGEHGLRLSFEPRLTDSARRWRFWQLAPRADHVVSLCAERGEPEPSLTVHEVVPLERAGLIEARVSRSSALEP